MKSKFVDKNGQEWFMELNVGLIEEVKEITGFDLDKVLNKPEEIGEILLAEPKKIVEVFYVICEDQINERKLTPIQFGKLFNRDTLDNAVNSFIEAIINFYPRASAGRALQKRLPELLGKMDEKIYQTVTENTERTLKNLEKDLKKESSNTVTN